MRAQCGRPRRRVPVHDFGPVETEPERIGAAHEADNEFPVGYVVGLDREARRLFGRIMFLELEADPSVLGLHAESVFLFVQRGRPGPVDIRPVLDSVLEGHDMRIVHRHAFSPNARLEVMDRAGMDLAIAESPDQAAYRLTGSGLQCGGKPDHRGRSVSQPR